MKVKIGNFLNYWGPYQIAELLMFWEPRYSVRAHEFGKWLAGDEHETWLSKVCQWIHSKRKRTVKIKLDPWDTWNMDDTLSIIILPMLKQLQRDKHGSAIVDPEDVPEDLRPPNGAERLSDEDNTVSERWDWVMNELIWTFEQLQPDYDWEEQYQSGEVDIQWKPAKMGVDGEPELYEMVSGPKHTFTVDAEATKKHQDRIRNGLRLFGKYYQGLWD